MLAKLAEEMQVRVEDLLQPLPVCINGQHYKLGCLLCEDGWSDDYNIKPIPTIHQNGPVDLFVNLSCSPFTLGKNDKRHRVFSRMARKPAFLLFIDNVGIQNNAKPSTLHGCTRLWTNGNFGALPSFEAQSALPTQVPSHKYPSLR